MGFVETSPNRGLTRLLPRKVKISCIAVAVNIKDVVFAAKIKRQEDDNRPFVVISFLSNKLMRGR